MGKKTDDCEVLDKTCVQRVGVPWPHWGVSSLIKEDVCGSKMERAVKESIKSMRLAEDLDILEGK